MEMKKFENPAGLQGEDRQTRHRDRQRSIRVTLDSKTADDLDQLVKWTGESSACILQQLVSFKRIDMFWARIRRIEKETGQRMTYDQAKALRGFI